MSTTIPYTHKAQFYETDSMRIVHHSNYVRWFEEARVDFLEQIGHKYQSIEAAGFESPVLSVHCEYKSMVHFADTVAIHVGMKAYSGVKMTICYTIVDSSTGAVRCTGETSHCFLDKSGKPVHLKRAYPALHAALSDSLVAYEAERE